VTETGQRVSADTASLTAPSVVQSERVVPGEPPAWLRTVAFVLAAAVLGLGGVGLLLAINGWYRAPLAFVLGLLVAAAVVVLARPALRTTSPTTPAAHRVAALGVIAIVALTAFNVAHRSEHVYIDRDGGSYLNTGRYIAREGSLDLHPFVGPFANEKTIGFNSLAVYQLPNQTVQFQFAHLLPALLAEGDALGGDNGLFSTPPILGGIALLAFFVLAWRLIRRPWFALAATLALGTIIPQVSFSRDSYSEIPSQILLFTALWVLVSRRVLPGWRRALTAGLFLGAMQAVRIDAVVFFIGVPVVFVLAWLLASAGSARRAVLVSMGAFVAGLVPGVLLGYVDLKYHSGLYFHDLWPDERKLLLVLSASVIGCGTVALVANRVKPSLQRVPWSRVATGVAVAVGVVGFGTWALRPRLQTMHGDAQGFVADLQLREHVSVDATRTYSERSLTWMSWYLGPITLAAAILGAAFLVYALIRGHRRRALGALAVLLPGSMLYLLKVSAVPDQVWATRRYLVGAFPLLILLALGFAAAAYAYRGPRFRRTVRGVGVVIAVVAVLYPIGTLIGVRNMSEKSDFVAVVNDGCKILGPHAAVVVLERDTNDLFDDWAPQTLRGFCGADVAVTRGNASTPASLSRLASEWHAQGRRFFVAAVGPDVVQQFLPGQRTVATRTVKDRDTLSMTLTHRPRGYRSETFSMVFGEIAPG